jgi:hypothetical protein
MIVIVVFRARDELFQRLRSILAQREVFGEPDYAILAPFLRDVM